MVTVSDRQENGEFYVTAALLPGLLAY